MEFFWRVSILYFPGICIECPYCLSEEFGKSLPVYAVRGFLHPAVCQVHLCRLQHHPGNVVHLIELLCDKIIFSDELFYFKGMYIAACFPGELFKYCAQTVLISGENIRIVRLLRC